MLSPTGWPAGIHREYAFRTVGRRSSAVPVGNSAPVLAASSSDSLCNRNFTSAMASRWCFDLLEMPRAEPSQRSYTEFARRNAGSTHFPVNH